MRRLFWHLMIVMAGLAVLVALRVTVAAQGAARQDQDILPALLVEIRGLRAAIEQMASTGPRVQLAMGRLQLQEQRVSALLRRQQDIRSHISSIEGSLEENRRQVIQNEQQLRESLPALAPERQAVEDSLKNARSQLVDLEAAAQRFRIEESDVAQELATEQAHWTDINQRLEELERALARR